MSDAQIRTEIRSLLEGGLKTETEPRAGSDEVRQPITDKLRAVGKLEDKLAIAGFTLKPVKHDGTEESCESCMYSRCACISASCPSSSCRSSPTGRAASGGYDACRAMIAVVGCGNLNRRDDGLGPEVVRLLRERAARNRAWLEGREILAL